MSDKRAAFFLVAAVACFVLVPAAPPEFRGFAMVVGGVYVVLALASFLDSRGRHR